MSIFEFLWLNTDLNKAYYTYIMEQYSKIRQMDTCICKSRNVYEQRIRNYFIRSLKSINIQNYRNYFDLQKDLKKYKKV